MSMAQDKVVISNQKLKIPFEERMGMLWKKVKTRNTWKTIIVRLCVYFLVFELAFVFLYPFLYMIATSFMSLSDLDNNTINWIPRNPTLNGYKMAIQLIGYDKHLFTTVWYVIVCTLGHVISCSLAAYGFSRYKFKFSGVLFAFVILSFIIPPQTTMVPSFFFWRNTVGLEIGANYLPLILPNFFGFGLRGGLFIFLFRQFFMTLPKEMEESARIDGCGPFQTFIRVMLPMAKSSILVAIVLSLVWHWNDSFEPSFYLTNPSSFLLAQRLPQLEDVFKQQGVDSGSSSSGTLTYETLQIFNDATIMAATFLVVLPLLLMYLVLQRYFIQGVERSGLVE